MSEYPLERPLALAVQAALEVVLSSRVGYGGKPAAGGWQGVGTPTPSTPFTGYCVVFSGITTGADGPVSSPSSDAEQGFQITSVGASGEQADAIRDRCRVALLAPGSVTVVGRTLARRVQLVDAVPITRDDDVVPPLFYAIDRFSITTSPG